MNAMLQSQLAPYAAEIRQRLAGSDKPRQLDNAAEIAGEHEEVMAQFSSDMKSWLDSPEGAAKVRSMQDMSLPEIKQELTTVLGSRVFARSLELISKPSLPILNHPIQSVFAAVKVEIVFGVGLSLSIGVAVDVLDLIQFIKDPKQGLPEGSLYVSGWADEGAAEGTVTGFEAGISGSAPGDFGGFALGAEFTFAPAGIGLTGQVYHGLSVGSWGALVGVVFGEEIGGGVTESYTIVLADVDLNLPHIIQPTPPNGHMLTIDIIQCLNSNENTDHVYFYFVPDGGTSFRFPLWDHRNMSENEEWNYNSTWYPGQCVKFAENVTINLWSETTGDDDGLGNVTFSFSNSWAPGQQIYQTSDFKNGLNEIEYRVWATLVY